MRAPISGLVTEVALLSLEAIIFQTFTTKFWQRHVDDTFVIKDADKPSNFHMALKMPPPPEFSLLWIRKRTVA